DSVSERTAEGCSLANRTNRRMWWRYALRVRGLYPRSRSSAAAEATIGCEVGATIGCDVGAVPIGGDSGAATIGGDPGAAARGDVGAAAPAPAGFSRCPAVESPTNSTLATSPRARSLRCPSGESGTRQ